MSLSGEWVELTKRLAGHSLGFTRSLQPICGRHRCIGKYFNAFVGTIDAVVEAFQGLAIPVFKIVLVLTRVRVRIRIRFRVRDKF